MNTLFDGKRFYVNGKRYTFEFDDTLNNFVDSKIILYGDSGDAIQLSFDGLRCAKRYPGMMTMTIGTTLVNGKWEDAAVFITMDDILRGTIVKAGVQNTNVNPADVKFVIGNPEYYYPDMEGLPEYYDIIKSCVKVEHVDIIPHMQPVRVTSNGDTKLEFIDDPNNAVDLDTNYHDLSSEMQLGSLIFIIRDHKVIHQTKNINDIMPLDRYHYTMELRSFDKDSVDIISAAIKTSISIFNSNRGINYSDIYRVVAKYIGDAEKNAQDPFQVFSNIWRPIKHE